LPFPYKHKNYELDKILISRVFLYQGNIQTGLARPMNGLSKERLYVLVSSIFFLYILCCSIFVSCRYYIHNVYCLARKKGKCCWIIEGSLLQVKAHPVSGSGDKAKDPIFGLKMGAASQASNDLFRC